MSVTMTSAAVALLSLTRAIKIQWPFYHIKKRFIYIWLVFIAVFELTVVVTNFLIAFDEIKNFVCSFSSISLDEIHLDNGRTAYRIHRFSKIATFPILLHAWVTVAVSVWAIFALARAIQQRQLTKVSSSDATPDENNNDPTALKRKFRGCEAIVIINFTSLVMVISLVAHIMNQDGNIALELDHIDFCSTSYIVHVILPSIIAASNPLILMKFNQDLRCRVTFWGVRPEPRTLTISTFKERRCSTQACDSTPTQRRVAHTEDSTRALSTARVMVNRGQKPV
jgi:hypothetical protein